ncbi:hypothetical protein CcI6DRAFT_00025 [Frankia sp. CcI6]|nr:hypothetical protein CcI6DRAFT_00025 [Frankia sp. CcI6]KDA45070.1 hypothetical protein BMG523Draft_00199 [Frankia sp. BMG5.23]OFB41625.1 hypothetical protein Manayef4_03520 [Frankia sp. CgIM4]
MCTRCLPLSVIAACTDAASRSAASCTVGTSSGSSTVRTRRKPRRRSDRPNRVNTDRLSIRPWISRIGVPAASGALTSRLRCSGESALSE